MRRSMMHGYIMRACVAAAAGVALSAIAVSGASTAGAAPRAAQARVAAAVTTAPAAVKAGTQLWSKAYNGDYGHVRAVVISPNGKLAFVTGITENDATNYTTVIAYNTATGARKWIKLYKGKGIGGCSFQDAIAVSPDSNTVYITAECGATDSLYEYATIAYNAATGAQKWLKFYDGVGGINYGESIAVSPNGKSVYVTGQSDSTASGVPRFVTVAYNAANGAQLWAKRCSGIAGSTDMPNRVAVSPNGKTVFVTGVSVNEISPKPFTDDLTIAYSAATGAQLWAKRYSGALDVANGYYNALAVSPSGKLVFVAGIQTDASAIGDGYETIAYNAATGARVWAKRYTSAGGADSVAVSPNGSTVFVTGESYSTSEGIGYATVAYNAATGAQRWAKSYIGAEGATPRALAYAVAVSPNGGTVYVTGLGYRPGWDYVTIAYNATTGAQQWMKYYALPATGGGTDASGPVAEAVSRTTGTVVVTGATPYGNWATVAYAG